MECSPALAQSWLIDPIIDVLLMDALVFAREMQNEFEFAFHEFEDSMMKQGQALRVLDHVHFYWQLVEKLD